MVNTSDTPMETVKTSFLCVKCLLLFLSLVFFVWGVFAYVPSSGPKAGAPSVLQKMKIRFSPTVCPIESPTDVVKHQEQSKDK